MCLQRVSNGRRWIGPLDTAVEALRILTKNRNIDRWFVNSVSHAATHEVLAEWVERLIAQHADRFPEKVTAFRAEMAAHGKYGEPCPVCGDPIQRIVFADRETNYCSTCQTGGRLLADRALSRLLKGDWPRSLEELESLGRK